MKKCENCDKISEIATNQRECATQISERDWCVRQNSATNQREVSEID